MERRKFIKGLIGLTTLGAFTGVYAWQIEPFWLEFVHKKMDVKNLPSGLIDKTVMQISDIHVSSINNTQCLIDSFDEARKYKPDYVVYSGDYLTYESPEQLEQLQEVMNHSVHGKLGTVGILGNHDYGRTWSENIIAEKIFAILKRYKIQLLRNEQTQIKGLNFIGFDDYWGKNFHPEKVMINYDSSKANIVLCHNPDVSDLDIWNGYEGWILSGHTHGGQVKPPFLDPLILPVENKNYIAGEVNLNDGRTLYINKGLGHTIQLRFNVRPEITIFELQKA